MFATIEDFLFNDYEHESVLPIFIYENNHLKIIATYRKTNILIFECEMKTRFNVKIPIQYTLSAEVAIK